MDVQAVPEQTEASLLNSSEKDFSQIQEDEVLIEGMKRWAEQHDFELSLAQNRILNLELQLKVREEQLRESHLDKCTRLDFQEETQRPKSGPEMKAAETKSRAS